MVTGSEQLPPAGVSVALLTPVTQTGAIDLDGLEVLVGRAVDAGVAGLSPCGSTGEGSRLSRAQRRQVVAHVAGAAQGRSIVAGLTFGAVEDTLAELQVLAEAGADAALLAPPGYYPLSDQETAEVFETLAGSSPLPIVLYQIPALARAGFSPEVVARLAAHPAVLGIKDSSRDLEYLRSVVRATAGAAGFRVVTGTDALLAESLAAGATGAVVASPNAVPDLTIRLWQACSGEDREVARRLQDELLDLVTACRRAGMPAGWKYAAALTGACDSRPLPPGRPIAPEVAAELGGALARLGLGSGRLSKPAEGPVV